MSQHRSLTPAIGMLRAFPVRIPMVIDESLHSFVHRLSARHNAPLGQTLSRLGLVPDERQKPLAGFGIVMTDQQVRNFSFVSGLSEPETRSLLLNKFSGCCLSIDDAEVCVENLIRKASVREWAYFGGSHFCPDCLRESGGAWSVSWKLPWSFACVKHQSLLIDQCPECGQRPGAGYRDGSLSPAFTAKVAKPGFCTNVLPKGLASRGQASMACGCNLMKIESLKDQTLTGLFDSQNVINEYLNAAKLIEAGESLTFFREMRSICALILYRAEVEDFPLYPAPIQQAIAQHIANRNGAQEERSEGGAGRNGARPRMFTGAPKSAALMAAVVSAALRIVKQTDVTALRESLRVLGERTCGRSAKYRYAVLNYFDLTDRLREALTTAIAARGSFDRRAGSRSTVRNSSVGKSTAASERSYEPRHVPQCMLQSEYEVNFKQFFSNVQDRNARRFCSLAAVKSLGYTWRESIKLLEMPSSMYGMGNRCITLFNQQGNYDLFAKALYEWTLKISDTKTRFDYARRREAFRNFEDFTDEQWIKICADSGVSKGKIGSRSKYAATWLWAEMTSGDWALAPAMASHKIGTNQHDVYRMFLKNLLPSLSAALQREGKKMLAAFGQGH